MSERRCISKFIAVPLTAPSKKGIGRGEGRNVLKNYDWYYESFQMISEST